MDVLHDAARQGQAQAPASGFRAVAGAEDVPAVAGADAHAVVPHLDHAHAVLPPHLHLDGSLPPLAGVQGVLDEILQDPLEEGLGPGDRDAVTADPAIGGADADGGL